MTVRDSITRTRARTPGVEDDPTSATVRDRALGPTQCGIKRCRHEVHEGRTQTKHLPVYAGSSLKLAMSGKAPVWKKRLELQAHSRFRIRSACGLPVATGRRS